MKLPPGRQPNSPLQNGLFFMLRPHPESRKRIRANVHAPIVTPLSRQRVVEMAQFPSEYERGVPFSLLVLLDTNVYLSIDYCH